MLGQHGLQPPQPLSGLEFDAKNGGHVKKQLSLIDFTFAFCRNRKEMAMRGYFIRIP